MSKFNLIILEIPVLPLRDIVVYPGIVVPLFIGRERSINALNLSINKFNKKILLVSQKNFLLEDLAPDDLFRIGTLSSILQIIKLPDGTMKILIEGINRVKINNIKINNDCIMSEYINLIDKDNLEYNEKNALINIILDQFETYIKLNKKLSLDIFNSIDLDIKNNIHKLIYTISSYIIIKNDNKQKILESINLKKQSKLLIKLINSEINLLQIEKKIKNQVKKQIEKNQKEYYLNEQIKAIQKELNDIGHPIDEYDLLKNKIDKIKFPKEVKLKLDSELQKLKTMPLMSAEASIIRNYIDCVISIPWFKKSKINNNLNLAKNILDNNHYGLDSVKDRILEYLSVQIRTKKIKGPILCLVGPPGIGKTSLVKSIAKSIGRKYIKISLGGVRDEAEIRGHRKTYIGSMPGKIIQKISKSKVNNPLILLDEIDKISYDMRGDPSSALLEVLDPEQNFSFNDHYLELDYDLSNVMFIATSNSISNIPLPLLDRMEIIKLSSYTEEEKLHISNNFLIKKQINNNALNENEIEFKQESILDIIRYYTRESGVRNLNREIEKICRKVVKLIVMNNNNKKIIIDKNNLKDFLGSKKFDFGEKKNKNYIGQVTGLAWTEVGGDLLTIESVCINNGKGKLIYTGSLGDVMKESIQAAFTVVKSKINILFKEYKDFDFYKKNDIHVHVPDGATPKDGPSAGVAICISIISCLIKKPIKSEVAMTGEITLNGNILEIGGLKEKILAAYRGGIKTVLIPKNNIKDIDKIPKYVQSKINIIPVEKIEEAIKYSIEIY